MDSTAELINASANLRALAAAHRSDEPIPGTHKGADGLLVCDICGGKKQTVIHLADSEAVVNTCCECEEKRRKEEKRRNEVKELRRRIDRMRKTGVTDAAYAKHTFEQDAYPESKVSKIARAYAEHFGELRKTKSGLLFYGPVGTGKTFYACCIANALINQAIPAFVTNTTRLLNRLNALNFDEEKAELIYEMTSKPLVVIDDVGAEHKSEYAVSQLFSVFDALYRSNATLVLTSNYNMAQLVDETNQANARIYDRILECCQPVEVNGESRRKAGLLEKRKSMENILGVDLG